MLFRSDSAWSAFGGYIWIGEYDFFKTQSLTLGSEIGVKFFLDLSALNPDEKAASYMTFSITGRGKNDLKTTRVNFADAVKNADGYYGFTCKVNALQMADTITATFHYGDDQTVSQTYSIAQYIESFEDVEEYFDEKTAPAARRPCTAKGAAPS